MSRVAMSKAIVDDLTSLELERMAAEAAAREGASRSKWSRFGKSGFDVYMKIVARKPKWRPRKLLSSETWHG